MFAFTEVGEAHQVMEGLTDLPSSHPWVTAPQ
jgi:hypothetical protein